MKTKSVAGQVLLSALYFVALYLLLFHTSQTEGVQIIVLYSAAFGVAALLAFGNFVDRYTGLACVLGATILPVFSFPMLSDDIYRFLWDGYLVIDGYDPLAVVPSEWIGQLPREPYHQLYLNLNSPDYHSVYPPVSQAMFALAVALERLGADAVVVLKVMYAAIHLFALGRFTLGGPGKQYPGFVLAYGLNPLVVVEGIGNLHAEIVMVAFLLMSWIMFDKRKIGGSAVFFALAVGTKLLPLMFLPLLWWLPWEEKKKWFGFFIVTTLALFIPFFVSFAGSGFMESIDLYYRKFEFNGGLYYLLRYAGKIITGYNLIRWLGPGMALAALVLILWISRSASRFIQTGYTHLEIGFGITLVYLFSLTTLHPWYLILPLAVSLFTPFRGMWIWTFLITGTYLAYNKGNFAEDTGIIGIEYSVVVCLLWWEYRMQKIKKASR